jgi:hypothetical protein
LKDATFLELTAQKHCAMHVQAEHYPIVYECFMEAVAKGTRLRVSFTYFSSVPLFVLLFAFMLKFYFSISFLSSS